MSYIDWLFPHTVLYVCYRNRIESIALLHRRMKVQIMEDFRDDKWYSSTGDILSKHGMEILDNMDNTISSLIIPCPHDMVENIMESRTRNMR